MYIDNTLEPDQEATASILIVEDEPYIRDICLRVLRRQGYQVTTAENGLAALERLRTPGQTFDLVLTDIEMPKMGGLELLRNLREHHADIDIIVFTAHATVETAREALKQGAFDYLHKPQIVEDLARTVQRALEWRKVRLEKQRLSEIVALFELSQAFTGTLDTGRAVTEIVRLLWRRFNPRALSISLLHPEEDKLELLAQRGELMNTAPGRRIAVNAHDERAIMGGHEGLVGPDVAPDTRRRVQLVLRAADRPVGLLRLSRSADQPPFAQDDRTMLAVCASQIGASLENARLYRQSEEQKFQIVQALAAAIDARDPYTRGHSEQVMRYSVRLAEVLGFPQPQVQRIRYGALLHDVGKIGIRDHILLKPGPLSASEYQIMQQHPAIGASILSHIKSLGDVIPMIRCHHERIDGGGYPDGACGVAIPPEARVISIADSYDAMTSDRAYRKGMHPEEAINVLLRGRGTQWDGDFVDAFATLIGQEGTLLTLTHARPAQAAYIAPVALATEVREI